MEPGSLVKDGLLSSDIVGDLTTRPTAPAAATLFRKPRRVSLSDIAVEEPDDPQSAIRFGIGNVESSIELFLDPIQS
jgi:hypothetical protein